MKTLYRAYRFRMDPTAAQAATMVRFAGARRFVWNWALARRRAHYAEHGKTLNFAAQSKELTALKRQAETEWLCKVPCQSLKQALWDLNKAFSRFFAKKAGYPRFKSRKRDRPRFAAYQDVCFAGGRVGIPKIGTTERSPDKWVRLRGWREIEGKTKTATFKRDAVGHWYASVVVEVEMPDVALPAPDPAKVVGIDLGLKDFAVLSTGERAEAPKFYRKAQAKLRRAQRVLCRREMGSSRRAKARLKVAKIHDRIRNQRADFLHKLSHLIVTTHGGVCVEDLCLKGLAKTKLAKSFSDAALGEFRRQLEYKAEWHRKHFVAVSRWYPSTKTCHQCKAINGNLTLSDRSWACGCGAVLDRDLNAARNIRDEGLRMLAAQ